MIDVMAIQPLLGRSTTTMLKSHFISIANAQQNMVYNTISPTIINFLLNIISVLIQTDIKFFGIKSPDCVIVQKLPASVTQNRKNIFLNTVNGKKSWEWRKIDSKIISIHSRIRENHHGNRPGKFCPYGRKTCPYRRNNQFGAKNMGKGTYETLPNSYT